MLSDDPLVSALVDCAAVVSPLTLESELGAVLAPEEEGALDVPALVVTAPVAPVDVWSTPVALGAAEAPAVVEPDVGAVVALETEPEGSLVTSGSVVVSVVGEPQPVVVRMVVVVSTAHVAIATKPGRDGRAKVRDDLVALDGHTNMMFLRSGIG